jgi:hypothetical protein
METSMRLKHSMALVSLALLAACASGAPARAPANEPSLISAEQLSAAPYPTAFDVVQALRPQWLRSRGRTSITQQEFVKVYLDNSLMGGTDQLRGITTKSIAAIRFLDGVQATQRWGLDHGQGAILVSTRREPKGM